jgi:hypothetical protein
MKQILAEVFFAFAGIAGVTYFFLIPFYNAVVLPYKWKVGRQRVAERKAFAQLMPYGITYVVMKFKGADGSMGFRRGQSYALELRLQHSLLVLQVDNVRVPYESYRAFFRNWEHVAPIVQVDVLLKSSHK